MNQQPTSLEKKTNKAKQLNFPFIKNYKKEFGGSLAIKGKRKIARPLATDKPIHLILKIDGKYFHPQNQSLHVLIQNSANRFNIQVYDIAVNWTHIHLTIKINSRLDYIRFI